MRGNEVVGRNDVAIGGAHEAIAGDMIEVRASGHAEAVRAYGALVVAAVALDHVAGAAEYLDGGACLAGAVQINQMVEREAHRGGAASAHESGIACGADVIADE